MSIKFVDSSDNNKYVQYRLMSDTFNTTPTNWQGVSNSILRNSKDLITGGGSFEHILTPIMLLSFNEIGYISTVGNAPAPTESDPYRRTDYLKIEPNTDIVFKGDSINQYTSVIAFYDVNKTYISSITNPDAQESEEQIHRIAAADVPQGTRYIRLTADSRKGGFVGYTPFLNREQLQYRIVDVPVGNNIYNQYYNGDVSQLDDSHVYETAFAILRSPDYNKLTISKRGLGYYLFVYFYDSDWVLISSETHTITGTLDIPTNTKYIAFGDYREEFKRGGTMVNYGEDTLPFEPYESALISCTKYKKSKLESKYKILVNKKGL